MTEKEPFEERLQKWTVAELKIELTKKNIYGPRKRNRIETRIAELAYSDTDQHGSESSAETGTANQEIAKEQQGNDGNLGEVAEKKTDWVMWAAIIALVGVIVTAVGVYYTIAK